MNTELIEVIGKVAISLVKVVVAVAKEVQESKALS